MTGKRDNVDLIALAVCVSVVLHALVMFIAAPRVMSRPLLSGLEAKRDHREPMRMKRYQTDPLRERVRTLPKSNAPAPEGAPKADSTDAVPEMSVSGNTDQNRLAPAIPMPEVISAPDIETELPKPSATDPIASIEASNELPPVFSPEIPSRAETPASPAGGIRNEESFLPFPGAPALPPVFSPEIPSRAETPASPAGGIRNEESFLPVPGAPAPAPVFEISETAEDSNRTMAGIEAPKTVPGSDYVFNNQVLDSVDEGLVRKEKAAVRQLLSLADAAPLETVTECSLSACIDESDPQWRYFKIVFTPKRGIEAPPVVPKDVVIIMDASGSIGSDRIIRCRNATKAILRSCFNSGDRFNLVAFRNRFSYAFREWRDCDAPSFKAADEWLSRLTAHGRTDVFSTISSVLTLPRDPKRPVIALVITDGDANEGVKETAEILSKFTALNDGLISVYMYGVKKEANRRLIDLLTRGNRGESFIHTGSRKRAERELEPLAKAFRDPVLTDLRIQFSSGSSVETYPRMLKNLYRDGRVEIRGRCPTAVKELVFSLKGLSGAKAYDSMYRMPFESAAPASVSLPAEWREERSISKQLSL